MNESGRHFRRELAYVVLEHVKWREVVAGNYPDDPRNRQAVAALRALAEYILALEPDDSRLVHLRDSAEHARQLDSYVPETGEACRNWGRTLGSYGFYQDCTPEEGLRKLTGASDKDDAEWAALGGDVLAEVTRSVARSLGFAGQDAIADADPEEAARNRQRAATGNVHVQVTLIRPHKAAGCANWVSSADPRVQGRSRLRRRASSLLVLRSFL